MIIMLQPQQISVYWDAIKHGIIIANKIPTSCEDLFCNRVLEKLMLGQAQCWMGVDEREGERKPVAFGVTTIEETALGDRYLYLHTLYAYRVIPQQDLDAIVPTLETFAKNANCRKLVTFTSSTRLRDYYQQQGFNQDITFWTKDIGG